MKISSRCFSVNSSKTCDSKIGSLLGQSSSSAEGMHYKVNSAEQKAVATPVGMFAFPRTAGENQRYFEGSTRIIRRGKSHYLAYCDGGIDDNSVDCAFVEKSLSAIKT